MPTFAGMTLAQLVPVLDNPQLLSLREAQRCGSPELPSLRATRSNPGYNNVSYKSSIADFNKSNFFFLEFALSYFYQVLRIMGSFRKRTWIAASLRSSQ
jgi:hypothetical protein